MQLLNAVHNVFVQLSGSLDMLTICEYSRPCHHLHGSSVGQHLRHIIEMFQCLESGYTSGVVNYEKRKRDRLLESDKDLASAMLKEIHAGLAKPDKALILEGVYQEDSDELMSFHTNYFREIVYNLEHTIHHMALIRVGIRELKNIELPDNFGKASATVKYNQSCAQ